ncbi:MAG: menaquinone biosynthesis protein [Terracidiphilus sp.]|nr:menaquinone biosynthesis protein [Terracidiphilus sp.]
MNPVSYPRLRIAAINFLNPAPLMWDFEHSPHEAPLAQRYQIDRMMPSECADRLASGKADIGLVPIVSLAANPTLRILPGCTIASKGRVRSLLLVHRAGQPLAALRSVAADTASRTTLAYARILFHHWGNPQVPFLPLSAELDAMLDAADAAILIGDPALLALEEQANRFERTGELLVYHDLAEEWTALMNVPFVSAVWAAAARNSAGAPEPALSLSKGLDFETWESSTAEDLIRSRDHGLQNIDALVAEWSGRIPIPEETIRAYLTTNIHYILDEECLEGMKVFFRTAASLGILPEYTLPADFTRGVARLGP